MTEDRLLPRAWLVVGLLFFVACLNIVARTMITTMHGSLVAAIPMTEARFGLLMSAFMCVYGVMSPFAGFLSDRFGRCRVILTAMLIWSVVTWLTGLSRSYSELLSMRVLMALSEVCYMPAAIALIADYHRGPTRGLATGIHATALVVGSMVSSIGGWLAERYGWSFAFFAVGAPSLAYCLALFFILRDPPREGAEEGHAPVQLGRAWASLFGRGSFLLMLGCVACLDGLNGILIGWLPTYMAEHFHLSQGAAGFSAIAYLTAAGVIGMLIAGAWADRWSIKDQRSRAFVPIIGLVVSTPAVVVAAHTPILSVAIGALVSIGFFRGFWASNLMPLYCLVSDPRYRASGFGLINTASVFTGGVFIYIGGWLRDWHVNFSYVIDALAVGQIAAIVLLLLISSDLEPGAPRRARAIRVPAASA